MEWDRHNRNGSGSGFAAGIKGFLFPPVVWAIFFVAIYSLQGAGCAAIDDGQISEGSLRLALTLLTLLAAGAILAGGACSAIALRRIYGRKAVEGAGVRQSRFLAKGAVLNAGLFFIATIWIGIPIAWTSTC